MENNSSKALLRVSKFEEDFPSLEEKIIRCERCPRLVQYRLTVPPAPAHRNEKHWRRPLPGFGDPKARLLILGLAPAPQGGNRTGRVFTGDLTGKFLMSALHHEGFANQSLSESCDDGLKLHDCYLTASVKCVPPLHKPLASEFANCSSYFANEIFLLRDLKCILALGRAAFETYFRFLGLPKAKFVHGGKYPIPGWPTLFASYHPTPRNVNTSLLTEAMFREVLQNIKHELR